MAIILRKQKDYAREIGIIELYWQLCDRVYETKRKDGARAQLMAQHSGLKAGFQKRYDKAKLIAGEAEGEGSRVITEQSMYHIERLHQLLTQRHRRDIRPLGFR